MNVTKSKATGNKERPNEKEKDTRMKNGQK